MSSELNYPITKTDRLNRVFWQKNSSTNEIFRDFWGDSNRVKIIYRKFNNDYTIDLYDCNSKFIGQYSINGFEFNLEDSFVVKKQNISFKINNDLCIFLEQKLNKSI